VQGNSREYRTVVLAGLLHDIGKLLQRGTFGSIDIRGKYPKISVDFVSAFSDCFDLVADISLLKTLVQKLGRKYNVGLVNMEHISTYVEKIPYRQVNSRGPPVNAQPIAREIADLIEEGKKDERLQWSKNGGVRILFKMIQGFHS
jgi:hypothetical protein